MCSKRMMKRLFRAALIFVIIGTPHTNLLGLVRASTNEELCECAGTPTLTPLTLERLPHKILTLIAAHLAKEDMTNFRFTNRKCAAAGFDDALLHKRGTRFLISDWFDLRPLGKRMQEGKFLDVPVICFNLGIDDNDLAHLARARHICLFGCHRITNAGLTYLKNAQTVHLNWCMFITDEGLHPLENVPTVFLQDLSGISDNGLAFLAKTRCVSLFRLSKITNGGLIYLKNAERVELSWSIQLSDEGILHLTNATTLILEGLTEVSQSLKDRLRSRGVNVID